MITPISLTPPILQIVVSMASRWSWLLLLCYLYIGGEAATVKEISVIANEDDPFNITCSYSIPPVNSYWTISPHQLVDTVGEGVCSKAHVQNYYCYIYHAKPKHSGSYQIDLHKNNSIIHTCILTVNIIPLYNIEVSNTSIMMSSTFQISSVIIALEKTSTIILTTPQPLVTIMKSLSMTSIIITSPEATNGPSENNDTLVTVILVTLFGLLVSCGLIVASVFVFFLIRYKRKRGTKHRDQESDTGFLLGEEREDLFETTEDTKRNSDDGNSEDISFNSILFQELVHKNKLILVHHASIKKSDVLVKQLKDASSKYGRDEIIHEVDVLKQLKTIGNHFNIISFIGTTVDPDPLCLVMEYLPYRSLQELLVSLRKGPIPDWYMEHIINSTRGLYNKNQISEDLFNILLQATKGAKYLADNGIVHGHLSTVNVTLGRRLTAKLCNFTVPQSGDYFQNSDRGLYLQDLAPEVIESGNHTIKSDVWSFGIMIYRIATFESREPFNIKQEVLYYHMSQGVRPPPLLCHSNELYYQMQKCWKFDKEERPDFSQLQDTLEILAQSPWTHLLFEISEKRKAYISENHQIYLQPPPAQYKSSNRQLVLVNGRRLVPLPKVSSTSLLIKEQDTTSGQASDFSSDRESIGSKRLFQVKRKKSTSDDKSSKSNLKKSQTAKYDSAQVADLERVMLMPESQTVTRQNPLATDII